MDCPWFTNAAELFHFYAADGTPLKEYLGEVYADKKGPLFAQFSIPEGADPEAERSKLSEAEPYMEYTGTDGRTVRFEMDFII